jgi:hypothetical protein
MGEPSSLATLTGEALGPVAVQTRGGLVSVWGGAIDTFPPVHSVMLRGLEPSGAPRGAIADRSELGMLSGAPHAAARDSDVLVTARVSNGGTRQLFAAIPADQLESGATLELPAGDLGAGPSTSRVIPTRFGAMVFTTVSVTAAGGALVAIPVRCAR